MIQQAVDKHLFPWTAVFLETANRFKAASRAMKIWSHLKG